MEHRFRYHHPRIEWPAIIQVIMYGYDGFLHHQTKPRCTFAELGKDCPVVKNIKHKQ
jgi:hypothetical protein